MSNVEREESVKIQRKPRYLQVLIAVFVVPVFFLLKIVWKYVQPIPFIISLVIISLIGWTWSSVLSIKGWWIFPEQFLVGIRILPFLPLEEFLFYPLGAFLAISIYAISDNYFKKIYSFKFLLFYNLFFTGIFFLLCLLAPSPPYFLYSQFLVFNLISFWGMKSIAPKINLTAILFCVVCLTVIGFVWDFFAFKYGWWDYLAITQIKVLKIPIDDFNFYLFAPFAAVTIYIFLSNLLNKNEK